MDILTIGMFFIFCFGIALVVKIHKLRNTNIWDPFDYLHLRLMVTEYKCEGCNFKKKRFFKKGDFVFQKVGTCRKCGKNVIISAIYEEKMKTKEELKWEREEAKWR